MSLLEEGSELQLDFQKLKSVGQNKEAVVVAIAQDAETGEVLIVGYANEAALRHSVEQSVATFYSTSRNELWIKGQTSGQILDIVDIRVNCEQNSLLYRVKPRAGGACHTRNQLGEFRRGCFYRRLNADGHLDNIEP